MYATAKSKINIDIYLFLVLELNGIHLDDVQPAVPPTPSVIDYPHEASEYEKKLIQVRCQTSEIQPACICHETWPLWEDTFSEREYEKTHTLNFLQTKSVSDISVANACKYFI